MDEEKLNISVRKFLKNLGIKSQRNIEEKIRDKFNSNDKTNHKKIKVKAKIFSEEIDLNETIEGEIEF